MDNRHIYTHTHTHTFICLPVSLVVECVILQPLLAESYGMHDRYSFECLPNDSYTSDKFRCLSLRHSIRWLTVVSAACFVTAVSDTCLNLSAAAV